MSRGNNDKILFIRFSDQSNLKIKNFSEEGYVVLNCPIWRTDKVKAVGVALILLSFVYINPNIFLKWLYLEFYRYFLLCQCTVTNCYEYRYNFVYTSESDDPMGVPSGLVRLLYSVDTISFSPATRPFLGMFIANAIGRISKLKFQVQNTQRNDKLIEQKFWNSVRTCRPECIPSGCEIPSYAYGCGRDRAGSATRRRLTDSAVGRSGPSCREPVFRSRWRTNSNQSLQTHI